MDMAVKLLLTFLECQIFDCERALSFLSAVNSSECVWSAKFFVTYKLHKLHNYGSIWNLGTQPVAQTCLLKVCLCMETTIYGCLDFHKALKPILKLHSSKSNQECHILPVVVFVVQLSSSQELDDRKWKSCFEQDYGVHKTLSLMQNE